VGDLADAVAATDGPWALAAIAVIGLYVLLWRYSGQIIGLLQENRDRAEVAVEKAEVVHQEVRDISSAIVTNHGSKNLGDAVDRLSQWMLLHLEEARDDAEELRVLKREFIAHISQTDMDRASIRRTLAEVDERLGHLETKQKKGA